MRVHIIFMLAALVLVSVSSVSATSTLDLPKWQILPIDPSLDSDLVLYCDFNAIDTANNVTQCWVGNVHTNASLVGGPQLVTGKIANALQFDGIDDYVEVPNSPDLNLTTEFTISVWIKIGEQNSSGLTLKTIVEKRSQYGLYISRGTNTVQFFTYPNGSANGIVSQSKLEYGKYYHIVAVSSSSGKKIYINGKLDAYNFAVGTESTVYTLGIGGTPSNPGQRNFNGTIDELMIFNRALSSEEIKLLYQAGAYKLGNLTQFRQISIPRIDITQEKGTFYATLEVSATSSNAYIPVPEIAKNLTITSAPKLINNYTKAPFYYQGYYWYRADKIQYELPIRFETIKTKGSLTKQIILDDDQKTVVYEKEFKVINPTGAKLHVVYALDPIQLGFSPTQLPELEIDGVPLVQWQPQNSTETYLIRTDILEPGEIGIHWLRSEWVITKEEFEFAAKIEDFREINTLEDARRLAENIVKGKGDTYIKVISIQSNGDLANITVIVPLKDIEDKNDVVETKALTGTRQDLEVIELQDGRVAVKVPAEAFVAGNTEIKVFYNKDTSFIKSLLKKIRILIAKIKFW